ncbi:MAG: helix-turn-helix domain-containing protein [Puniceicoccales bacterium]|jgi:excisionase family DNA binding protein|nr:helix-turn-helix domain-containing protein [Puniceicoccales bacterium]
MFEKQYLTRKEAAEYLRVKPQTLAKWACTRFRKIPYCKVGSRVLYDYDDIQAFVKEGYNDNI